MSLGIARLEAMLASLQMRLEHAIDDIDVIERVQHALKHALARLRGLAFRQPGDGFVYQFVRPGVVTREHAGIAGHCHRASFACFEARYNSRQGCRGLSDLRKPCHCHVVDETPVRKTDATAKTAFLDEPELLVEPSRLPVGGANDELDLAHSRRAPGPVGQGAHHHRSDSPSAVAGVHDYGQPEYVRNRLALHGFQKSMADGAACLLGDHIATASISQRADELRKGLWQQFIRLRYQEPGRERNLALRVT